MFNLAKTLADNLVTAWSLFVEKRDIFRKLSEVHATSIPEWYHMDRSPIVKSRGVIQSVYRHSISKGGFNASVLRLLY
jgi:hypothetical protein